jgi:hypothetical protein
MVSYQIFLPGISREQSSKFTNQGRRALVTYLMELIYAY